MYTKLSKKTNTTLINIVLTEKDYHCNIWHNAILIGFVKVCPNQYYLNFNAKINVFSTLLFSVDNESLYYTRLFQSFYSLKHLFSDFFTTSRNLHLLYMFSDALNGKLSNRYEQF